MRINRKLLWMALWMLVPVLCSAQEKTLTVRPLADAPAIVKRALVVAVSNYEHANPLPETLNDARAYVAWLKSIGFPDNAITVMTDAPDTPEKRRPTYTHLIAAFDTLLNGIDDKSEVVIVFTGHGTRFGDHDWLMPLDGLASNVKATCIDYDEFKSRLNTQGPGRALLIVDACRNLQGGKDAGSSGFGASKSALGPQIAEFLSCQPKEVSQIGKPEDFQESVFTHYLLQGLNGDLQAINEQGLVTFDSLKLFVRKTVSNYVANAFGESQNPDSRTTLGSMVLARAGAAKPAGKVDRGENVVGARGNVGRNREQLPAAGQPPAGAIVLFDGSDLSAWTSVSGNPAAWMIQGDVLEVVPKTGDIRTKEVFKDYQLHVEFNLAYMPNQSGQARSNSGVFLNGQYEIQILDSVNNPTFATGGCGAICYFKDPDQNVCKPPGEWQTYDITFHSPRLDAFGRVIEKPRVTIFWNGVKVHNDVEIDRVPDRRNATIPMLATGPIELQDHPTGARVRFRNIWIKRL
jgi:uncharacterized caspase-like protein